MADSNMTIGTITGAHTTGGRTTRLRSVTFTHTAAGTAAGNATTTFKITGKLLRLITTGGDAAWDVTLNDGTADIWTRTGLTATATSLPLYMRAEGGAVVDDETSVVLGIPLVNQSLKCTTANVSTTAPTITVIWEEDEVTYKL